MPRRIRPVDVVSSKPISWELHVTKDHPVESCNAYRSDLAKSGVLSDNFCRCLPYWGTVVMLRRPGEDYTAHGAHYTATSPPPPHNAHRSYAVSGTLFPSSCVKLIPLFFRSSRSDIRAWTSTRLTRSTVYLKWTNSLIYDSFNNAVRLSKGPQPLPKSVLHRVWSRVSNVYWTVHHSNSWRIKDQLDVTCYFISLLMCSTCFGH